MTDRMTSVPAPAAPPYCTLNKACVATYVYCQTVIQRRFVGQLCGERRHVRERWPESGHTTVTIGVIYRCPNITKQNNEKIHNAIISEVSKGDCSGWLLLVRTLSTLRAPLDTLGWCLLLHNRCQTVV